MTGTLGLNLEESWFKTSANSCWCFKTFLIFMMRTIAACNDIILIYNYLHSLLKINIQTGKQRLFTKSSLVNNYDTTKLFIVTHKHLQRQISTLNNVFPAVSQSVLLDLWDPCCKPNPFTNLSINNSILWYICEIIYWALSVLGWV